MSERRGRARIVTEAGVSYMTLESHEEIAAELHRVPFDEDPALAFLTLTTVTGQDAFPPEALHVRVDQIVSVQEMSAEGWIWAQRANELHYARLLQEDPGGQIADAQQRLVAMLEGADE